MTRPLRLVNAPTEEVPTSLTYVVSRTRLAQPGTPYVIAALVDPVLAEDYRYSEAETYTAPAMRSDRRLAEALRRWNEGDHRIFVRDREAHERLEANYRASMLRSALRHPSMLSRA
jgi:hypothetical protein